MRIMLVSYNSIWSLLWCFIPLILMYKKWLELHWNILIPVHNQRQRFNNYCQFFNFISWNINLDWFFISLYFHKIFQIVNEFHINEKCLTIIKEFLYSHISFFLIFILLCSICKSYKLSMINAVVLNEFYALLKLLKCIFVFFL